MSLERLIHALIQVGLNPTTNPMIISITIQEIAAVRFYVNLIIIIDYNKLQSIDSVKNTLNLEPLDKKFISFGYKAIIVNGHNCEQIFRALNSKSSKPLVIIANTVKGKGVSFMENSVLWHYKSLNSEDYQRAMKIVK